MDNAQENGSADNMKRPSIIFLKLKSLVHAMHYNVHNKSIISQKVKSRNGCFKKTAHQILRKANISYPLIRTRTCAYYNVHNRQMKTPLQVMNAQAIYKRCKSWG